MRTSCPRDDGRRRHQLFALHVGLILSFGRKRLHVDSGTAEAACKTVVSTRAKRSGTRWTLTGLDAVLALRTAVLNQLYDTFWEHRSRLVV